MKSALLSVAALSLFLQPLAAESPEKAATAPPDRPLIDLTATGAENRFVPSSDQVNVTHAPEGVVVTIQPGKDGYPGVRLTPEEKFWDLSQYGHVEVRVVNTGPTAISLSLAVDNEPNGSQRNTESGSLKPGEARAITVIFGYAYGKKPAYKLKPEKVGGVLLFTGKSKQVQSYRIESLHAGGPAGEQPPFDPNTVRVKPQDGVLFGKGVQIDAEKQIMTKDGAEASVQGENIKMSFPKGKGGFVTLKPVMGRWDLREALEVRVKIKNTGEMPIIPKVLLNSNKGPGERIAASAPIAPGASGEVVASFIPKVPWRGIKDSAKTSWEPERGTGTKFGSDAVSSVTISSDPPDANRSFVIESIVAGMPPAPALPDWLGKRPPVEGDWVMTFQEEFEGNKLDDSKWRIYTENFWDKKSHFSKDNVILGGGVVKLRYEKKRGYHNDDPAQTLALTNPKVNQSDYATGFLDTYGKWVQRYGYFESRMKLTKAPGLWPAFWVMPDRGAAAGPQWKRQATEDGGMEFDVMEHLGRWGPYRYNIAFHWDGYGKKHQQTGSECIYFRPDKDGFVTSGLLWLPGLAVIYANGIEVARWETPRISNVPSDIMFTNVTGGWDNDALDDSKLPDDYVIDYVRVWQRKDLASDVDGPQTAPSAAR